ncbi:type II toxin-antitoxin system HicB family antitoxin [Rubrivivax sp. JA1024]|nr:type II toxin-antitoxin system HicB family antitoxin [Rubrivivax sp. JA1024]
MSASSGYLALVYKDSDTSYGVAFPDVPGCISAGDTFEQAIDNAAEALGGHLALLRADGDPIPQPRSIEQLRDDPEFVADAADAVVAFVRPEAEQAAAE